MPQEIRVLKCYKCNTFQTDIVKKVKKWTCKMCGAKQSVMQEYGRGSGMDCRLKVQKLNKINDENLERQIITNALDNWNTFDDFSHKEMTIIENIEKKENKWLHYVETPQKDEEESNDESNMVVNTMGNCLITKKPLKRLNDTANSKLESNKGSLLNFSLNKNDKEKSNELVPGTLKLHYAKLKK